MPKQYIRKKPVLKYSAVDLKSAVESVQDGASIRETAKKFHIPYTTLHSHLNEEVTYDRAGRPTKFNKDEETCLVESALTLQVRKVSLLASSNSYRLWFDSNGVSRCRLKNLSIWPQNMPFLLERSTYSRPESLPMIGFARFFNDTTYCH